jgi:hypothetical protein
MFEECEATFLHEQNVMFIMMIVALTVTTTLLILCICHENISDVLNEQKQEIGGLANTLTKNTANVHMFGTLIDFGESHE